MIVLDIVVTQVGRRWQATARQYDEDTGQHVDGTIGYGVGLGPYEAAKAARADWYRILEMTPRGTR